ncbi:MAG: DUF4430 domain-containing protein [Lachnospiraceae bacterium]|nr:DUF4430 domain-containing protein [Lachnospiraceae bacterium]
MSMPAEDVMRNLSKLFLALILCVGIFTSCASENDKYQGYASLKAECSTVFDNMDLLKEEKKEIIPDDGVIFYTDKAGFKEGETVFDLFKRQMQEEKLQYEFKEMPGTDIVYIDAIGNLYSFDCGEQSGWLFKINGEFPLEACNQIKVNEGDEIEFLYTCDWGIDIGAYTPE